MSIFSLFTMLGGLALFIYGMQLMGDSLEKAASDKLESMLQRLTSSKWKGMLLGLVVTAIIQSSSATTVTVVGFVNSGIMKLGQAISVIMGANIGTTVTAWILSLTGIEGSNFIVQLFKPTSFSPILAVIGVGMIMFSRNDKKKEFGRIFIGFAILMFGMETMSGAVKPLADIPEFAKLFTLFENPIFGVLVGAVVTGIIQSSSASVGILQALSVTGSISYAAAIPIIMGQNIGTCVTSLIACIGANKNARRAAMVHLYFNIIGTAIFLTLYIVLHPLIHPDFWSAPINVIGIAVVHSVFNLATTALLMPFTNLLERLAILTIRDKQVDEPSGQVLLDERLLITPTFALTRCKEVTADMAEMAESTIMMSITQLDAYDKPRADAIVKNEQDIDKYEDVLGSFLVKLSGKSLSRQETRDVSKILHSINDFERISDHALNLQESAAEIHEKHIGFSASAQKELTLLIQAVEEILHTATRAFITNDIPLAKWVEPLEEVIDDLIRELKLRHIDRLQEGACTIETGFVFHDILANLERVADHCSNVAICVIELEQDEYNAHEYLNKVKRDEFEALYTACKRKYSLAS